ncbi:MAG: hypothetical protein JJE46_06780 [Acidimicrobiia bacterium]|nr:hypothetical protein [Acidimicrobiia bacterium]
MPSPGDAADDPVLARRARIATQVNLAKRIGYFGLLVAIVGFGIGMATTFSGPIITVAVIGLVVGFVILPIPIVLAYGVKAADREDQGGGSFH